MNIDKKHKVLIIIELLGLGIVVCYLLSLYYEKISRDHICGEYGKGWKSVPAPVTECPRGSQCDYYRFFCCAPTVKDGVIDDTCLGIRIDIDSKK